MAPKGKPISVPRSQGFQERFQSSRFMRAPSTWMISAGWRRRWAATQSASPTANRPTATTTTSMPSASSGIPSVSRCCPEVGSMPTVPMSRPMPSAARPRILEEPRTVVTAMNASIMMAK